MPLSLAVAAAWFLRTNFRDSSSSIMLQGSASFLTSRRCLLNCSIALSRDPFSTGDSGLNSLLMVDFFWACNNVRNSVQSVMI